jgi:lactate dehydrogenase-like 2-hydroxyacid dehydrogenase
LESCVLLPHLGSATAETRQAMGQMALDNIIAFSEGREPPQKVN